ncbi:hypothetical protein [Runella sp. SP2]|uniref:hypothetical protein n=1 Tax=Runella sp. SP2 TaxID=2268026 RepID=UPI000F093310|nr:hypothetical protein [Runella sp. SP2]AYQ33778.1 hypothetical protein DTQ70_17160 [Runella sp. SP2]
MNILSDCPAGDKECLIKKLTSNRITHYDLNHLMQIATSDDLKSITQSVFDMDEATLLERSAVEGATRWLNSLKNERRKDLYVKKIQHTPRHELKKVVAEGDSWFNYPLILTDILDWISMDKNTAVFSLASASDWLVNILASREYVNGLSVHQPDFFLMSGGGNDVGGMSRMALMVSHRFNETSELTHSAWAQHLIANAHEKPYLLSKEVSLDTRKPDEKRWNDAIGHLSKDFFALMMLFRLQYYSLFHSLLVGGNEKFPDLKIITQGYDFLVPSDNKGWGINPLKWYIPVLRWIGHGWWLKKPLIFKEISGEKLQLDILYACMYFFNEMMIELEEKFMELHPTAKGRLFHVDSRGLVQKNEWTDEIHPQPHKFRTIAQTYLDCIHGQPSDYKHVYRSINRQKP